MSHKKKKEKIIILGDLHFPYHNQAALDRALAIIEQEQPTTVVQIGDLFDQYAFSRFTKKNITLPMDELSKALEMAETMWQCIHKLVPKAALYQILGNHDIRMVKRVEEKVPEAQDLIRSSLNEIYTFDHVKTLYDDREELILGDIVFLHGYRSRIGDHMRFNRKSTVCGHSHVGGVVYEQHRGRTLFELNAGYLADEKSEPLKYRPQTSSKWTLGIGLIDEHGPRFIPFEGV